jgi:dihydrofolate synthase / folylpolyglutamate synthase
MDHQTYLKSFVNFESHLQSVSSQSFNLQRVHRLFEALGNPQKKLIFIHVAGTKGKGSTCAFAAYILRAAGYRVGLYTSPHLYRVHERIRVLEPKASTQDLADDFYGAISDKVLSKLVKRFQPVIDKLRHDQKSGSLTYFEVLTALALCHFQSSKADIVVLETGLGGRLDATNAVDAVVNGITPISLDHMDQLGSTLAKIAGEKAAIIKDPVSKVVVAQQPAQAMRVIRARCRHLKIVPLLVGKDIRFKAAAHQFHVKTPAGGHKGLKTVLPGAHQLHNAAMAIAMVESSGLPVGKKSILRGIRETRWPARLETVYKNPTVVVDCAHNPASAQVLMHSIRRAFPGKKAIVVLGLSGDKDIKGICRIFAKNARSVVTTQSAHPRAYQFFDKSAKTLLGRKFLLNAPSVPGALTTAIRKAAKNDVIVVAGSIFIAAEARALFKR